MNIKLNHKIIIDLCGPVSFKRGDAFFRSHKVKFEHFEADRCEATVIGAEDFHVIIEKDDMGGFRTECSCPSLASFQKDCQHIAAVLMAINEQQRLETTEEHSSKPKDDSMDINFSEGLLSIFQSKPRKKSGQQLHFEKRKTIDAEFILSPINIDNGQFLLGIEIKIEAENVEDIRGFFKNVKEGKVTNLSPSFTYDPSQHCFSHETNVVLQQLIQIVDDEKIFIDNKSEYHEEKRGKHQLIIPPSSWDSLFSQLRVDPKVKLEVEGEMYEGLHLSTERLPLRFDFSEIEGKGYQLKMRGFNKLIILGSYSLVLTDGTFVELKDEDCQRLTDMKRMLDSTGKNAIPIAEKQVGFFLEKVVPGLKKLGEVHLSKEISSQLVKTPLSAKLFLDRVKNRLLVGLEFHYENVVINPLEDKVNKLLIRDVAKENTILELMEDSSFAKTDGGYFLHNEDLEYEFLYYVVPKLQKLVQIYATTAVRNRIFRESAPPKIRVKVKRERTNWLEFKFEMDGIPDSQIRELLSALEEKRKYYRLRNGSLLSLETREFKEIQRFLNALPVQNEDLESGLNVPIVQGLRLMNSVEEDQTFTYEESFRRFLETIENPSLMNFKVPENLQKLLRDYQTHGYKWMKTLAGYGFGGILADDMGLGKTLQSIAYIASELPDIRKRNLPVLVVCPSSLTYNWLSELLKFTPDIQAIIVDGKQSERLRILKEVSKADVVITSYPLLRKDIKTYENQKFHTVFFDEAQAFKNPITQTARAVKKIKAVHRFALTGTPVENSLEELWSIFHVVFPELFMGLREYSHLSKKKIARRIRPFLLRRLKEDVLGELPEKIESLESMELLPEQKKLYATYLAKLRHDTLKHLDKDTLRKNKIRILAGLTRLRQICCHPALFVDGYKGSSAKFEQLLKIVEEAQLSGRRVLIFSQFTKMLNLIGKELTEQGLAFFYLDGQTPSEERVEVCHRFNEGERDLFLISLKAGGTGLNLTGADTVILYDLWWNPAVEEQAADRAHRMGQKNVVQVIKLVSRGTIEEKMNELQEKKRNLIEEIIDPEQKENFSLTEEDIREILMI
ncbi:MULTISPECIES: DEAD/DEAH box helicase [unclassified Bacillus (in: firmicutes)]|uniref:DEAD/DEAH box helicase n=1 Tax=unclassified Bacillus (in: firmicutes) TaxID=185979 RepID=UPI0008F3FC01|nr:MULTISPECIES: DEAD/DEAH box helicase [unclassified Bacillus (in: firmicutes)]SFB09549.1 Superfamily II DNA or RNA helicase, SNF2 family [Bacillus sp. UNCCL13]SFQ86662.1 Superfamily II DNA or RNA helicase, SNF2 family [Bacillus sp. cl95]